MPSEWTAPAAPERREPDRLGDERPMLEEWVDYQRATLLTKCAGLTAEQLKRPSVPPSTMTLLGLVRHMTEVERWWFRMHAAGEDIRLVYSTKEDPDADWFALDEADPAADIATYLSECGAARRAVADMDLEAVVPRRGRHAQDTLSLRWIFTHMIEEYARHNGHADLLREAIDDATGD